MKVFLTGGDRSGWALDTDHKLAFEALSKSVELVSSPSKADVIHTVWPEELVENSALKALQGQPVVASFSNDPFALFERIPGLFNYAQAWFCIGQTQDAVGKLKSLGIPFVRHVPYCADFENFYPLKELKPKQLRQELGIPEDKYLIGSFQRDSNANNLKEFKPQKGADIFLAILLGLKATDAKEKFHVVLAGPRRHWIIEQLEKHKIPFSFLGKRTPHDDFPKNILEAHQINRLMNAIDVYVVSSRWEGAPRAILEAAQTKTSIISSQVGIAADILNPSCIYEDISTAVGLLKQDIESKFLASFVQEHQDAVIQNHSLRAIAKRWLETYAQVSSILEQHHRSQSISQIKAQLFMVPRLQKIWMASSAVIKKIKLDNSICILDSRGDLKDLLKLFTANKRINKIFYNDLKRLPQAKIIIVNGSFEKFSVKQKQVIIHRIHRDQIDNSAINTFNAELANATAFEDFETWQSFKNQALVPPKNPCVIRNPGILSYTTNENEIIDRYLELARTSV